MIHLLIFGAVMMIIVAEIWLRSWRRTRRLRKLPNPDRPLEEHFSPSGRYKAVVFEHDADVVRIEVLRLVDDEPTVPFWELASGASFVDRASLRNVVTEALASASGERGAP